MAQYFPKSQISPDLYTNGKEFIVNSTQKEYIGNYYSVSGQSFYSGKSPTDGNSSLLIPIPKSSYINPHEDAPDNILTLSTNLNPNLDFETNYRLVDEYSLNSTFSFKEKYVPVAQMIPPLPIDYNVGTFTRYFCKKNNENLYFGINKKTFTDLKNKSSKVTYELYTPIALPWVISGNEENVFNANKSTVFSYQNDNKLYGFSSMFFNNFTQYFQSPFNNPSISLNYTKGGEFLFPNRTNYIGYYHQMENGTYMTGKFHGEGNDIVLISLNKKPQLSTPTTPTPVSTPASSPITSGGGGGY